MSLSLPALNLGFGSGPAASGPQDQNLVSSFQGARKESMSLSTGIVFGTAVIVATIIFIRSK